MKDKDDKPSVRNWVKKAVDELGIKASRHADRKHDYDRAHRRKAERSWDDEDSTLLEPREPRLKGKRLGKGKDRSRNSKRELDSVVRDESDENSPDAEEV
jgi:hypothetical protein